jgi:hypothetical protein
MRIRGYGSLVLADSAGNRGSASIDRARRIIVDIDNVRFGANLATTTVARPAAAL